MTSTVELKKQIIEKLNKEYGTSLLNTNVCLELKSQYEGDIQRIKAEVRLHKSSLG